MSLSGIVGLRGLRAQAAVALTLLLSTLTRRLVERPALRRKAGARG